MRWLVIAMLVAAAGVGAQPTVPDTTTTTLPTTEDTGPPPGPADPLLRGVPRTSARNYLLACREGDYARAADYLDLRRIPRDERARRGPILARQLKVALDRTVWVEVDTMNNTPEGDTDDGLPPRREVLASIRTQEGPVDLYLDRVPREDGVLIWKISSLTVDRVPELYEEFGYGPLADILPEPFFRLRFLEVQAWQWIGFLVLALAAACGAWAVAWLVMALLRPVVRRTRGAVDDRLLSAIRAPLRFGAGLLSFAAGIPLLRLSVPVQRFVGGAEQAAIIVLWTWLLLRSADALLRVAEERLAARGQVAALSMLPLGRRSAKTVIVALGVIAALQHIGFNITGIIAGLGVGGLAVALAAQKSVENLISGVLLVADQPVRVGDVCRFGTQVGVVEDIGFRSTRIRTADRTIISVPNSVFAAAEIENFSRRERIRLTGTFTVRADTTSSQLRRIIDAASRALRLQEKIDPDSVTVRLTKLSVTGPELELTAFACTTDPREFQAIREQAFLHALDAVADAGASLAGPTGS